MYCTGCAEKKDTTGTIIAFKVNFFLQIHSADVDTYFSNSFSVKRFVTLTFLMTKCNRNQFHEIFPKCGDFFIFLLCEAIPKGLLHN